MKVDSHQHFWKYDPKVYSWLEPSLRRNFLPKDLEPILQKNGFDACIAVQADQSEAETKKLLQWAKSFSFIKGVVGWLDLSSTGIGEKLDFYSQDPHLIGLRHTVWDEGGEFMSHPDFDRGIQQLQRYDLAFDILAFDYQLWPAVELVKRHPDQIFVLDHMGKPPVSEGMSADWVTVIKVLGSCENVCCKISGLISQAGLGWQAENLYSFLDVVIESFGMNRLLFGSDWPICLPVASYEQVYEAYRKYFHSFSKEDKMKIFGGNAIRCYNLESKI